MLLHNLPQLDTTRDDTTHDYTTHDDTTRDKTSQGNTVRPTYAQTTTVLVRLCFPNVIVS